jgi:tetratricopeptide (TPR) repeat protein
VSLWFASIAAVIIAVAGAQALAAQRGLTGAPELSRAYDAIFDAEFDRVPVLLARDCASFDTGQDTPFDKVQRQPLDNARGQPVPAEACQLIGVAAIWWQIQVDPYNRLHDAAFVGAADSAVVAVEAWTRREPQLGEAWFYLGAALGVRAQWRVLRGERLAAARDGKRIKDALERALALDPSLQDAYVGLGLYHYYAAVAPAAVKMLRWLLFLPGGNRALGLEEVLKAKSAGALLRDEADYQLHLMYLWYERQPARAIALLMELDERHPRNPHFLQLIAEIQDYRERDFDASRRSYEELLRRVRERRINLPAMAETHARLGLARLSLPQDALVHLQRVIETRPASPFSAVAQAHLQRGEMLDRLGRRDDAAVAYRNAIRETPSTDPLRIIDAARRALGQRR